MSEDIMKQQSEQAVENKVEMEKTDDIKMDGESIENEMVAEEQVASSEIKRSDNEKPVASSQEKKSDVIEEKKPAKSFMDTVNDIKTCVIKKAPSALRTTLTVAGKGADALSKVLHKMAAMVPESSEDAKCSDTKKD